MAVNIEIQTNEAFRHETLLARWTFKRLDIAKIRASLVGIPIGDVPVTMVQDLDREEKILDTMLSFMPQRALSMVTEDPNIASKTQTALSTIRLLLEEQQDARTVI